ASAGVSPPTANALEDAISAPLPWCEEHRPDPATLPVWERESDPHRTWETSLTPALRTAVQAYARVDGRITPEDWAAELVADRELREAKAFRLLDLYTAVELCEEGMNPRLTGLGSTPWGCVAVPCLAAGVYHACDPDSAYVDAVELASVWQRRPATDWAALCAAALAAALTPGATPQTVTDEVLQIAADRAPDAHRDLLALWEKTAGQPLHEVLTMVGVSAVISEWHGFDPAGVALVLLRDLGDAPRRLLAAAARMGTAAVYAPVVFAIAGALWGEEVFASEWRQGASELVEPMRAVIPVVEHRLDREGALIRETERLLQPGATGEALLYEKIYGCVLAGAIGNAMGSVCEGMLYSEVIERYPEGVLTVLNPGALENEDDNQMALLLTKTYLRREGRLVTARDFGATWMTDMRRDGFWLCCRSTYDLIRSGMDPRIAGHWNLVTGSTVMCMEPVGLFHLADPRGAQVDARAISYMEQRGLDVTAAVILAASVAEAMRAEATVESVCQAALAAAPDEPMRTFDDRGGQSPRSYIARCLEVAGKYDDVLAARAELYEKCLLYHHIDPLELLGLSYAMFLTAKGDVRQAAIGGTNIGRDADTIAGRAAMLSGTLKGAQTVPNEWVALFSSESLSLLQSVARRFVELHRDRKLPALRQRQGWAMAEAP
ncbi:MAG: ADP-ribosylglycohydrolase family protein, partial [Armatimonadetes bacterium]|nr:ADP-ribosylglycohydrolase family protein [Armatimonadota bacterium]